MTQREEIPDEWPEAFCTWYQNLLDFTPAQMWPYWQAAQAQAAAPAYTTNEFSNLNNQAHGYSDVVSLGGMDPRNYASANGVRQAAVEPVASSNCPICGENYPHAHWPKEIVYWLQCQASRFIPDWEQRITIRDGAEEWEELVALKSKLKYTEEMLTDADHSVRCINEDSNQAAVKPVAWRWRMNGEWHYGTEPLFVDGFTTQEPLYTSPPDHTAEIEALQTKCAMQKGLIDGTLSVNRNMVLEINAMKAAMRLALECIYDHDHGKYLGPDSKAQRVAAIAALEGALK